MDAVRARGSGVDEARSVGTRLYHPHRLTPLLASAEVGMRIDALAVGPLTIGTIEYSTGVRIDTDALDAAYEVNVPLEGRMRTTSGTETLVATSRRAALYRRDVATAIEGWDMPSRMLALKIPREVLEGRLACLLDLPAVDPIAFRLAVDLDDRRVREWWVFVRHLSLCLWESRPLTRSELMVDSIVTSILTGLLTTTGHQYRDALERSASPASPRAVHRAVEIIHAMPERVITVAELARVSGVGVRALQAGFRDVLGVSPLGYVKRVRLHCVREELAEGNPHDLSVADVARRWGFVHLGRFAGDYERRYGERPSDTLRSSGGWATNRPPHVPVPQHAGYPINALR